MRVLPYVLRLMGAGLFKPKNGVPGTDVAGRVESVGKNVRGYQWTNGGAFAEYVSASEDALALERT